ncbi:MAG TPA: AAA family ATPase [Terracidiphilus sp.]|nr:AAA family ATPase [Terracidiphilus sp.]
MTHRPFLNSIRPVNLLSFGPDTPEIELRPLNVLIGPNGSGKSNFIEIIRLLHFLPDKEPWNFVLETGGVSEWIWKGGRDRNSEATLRVEFSLGDITNGHLVSKPRLMDFAIALDRFESSFRVGTESVGTIEEDGGRNKLYSWIERRGSQGELRLRSERPSPAPIRFDLNLDRSVLSQLTSLPLQAAGVGQEMPELFEVAEFFEKFDFHQDWEFGADLSARDPVPVGQSVERLEEDGRNLAQMLTYYRDYHGPTFERISEMMKQFYGSFQGLDVRLIGTHLQPAIREEGGFSVSAYRMSDGALRWLALLAILLNPMPAPVICIDEPELGLHPDAIHTLADLLVEASKRTQMIVTTHSDALLDAFTDTPEVVCVCEKVEGSTRIKRLDNDHLKAWLEKYSLGKLWMSGEIGGNRW